MYCLLIKHIKDNRLKSISSEVYENFLEAYNSLRERLKELAYTMNNVFNGHGNIKELRLYFKKIEKEYQNEDWWSNDYMKPLIYLRSLVLNEDVDFESFNDNNLDQMLTWHYKDGNFELYSDKEGPINGINPMIKTNISSKNNEHCYLYIKDDFGGNGRDEYSVQELQIDLVKINKEICY